MTQGDLYILYEDAGQKKPRGSREISYTEELKKSILSLRAVSNLPITVYTNKEELFLGGEMNRLNIDIKKCTNTFPTPEGERPDSFGRGYCYPKLFFLKKIPYDITLFIDADTLILDDPSELMEGDYDLAIAREATNVLKRSGENGFLRKWFNTGVFVAKKNKRFEALIDKAIELFRTEELTCDQRAINFAINHIYDINIKVLPQQWNVRYKLREFIPADAHKIRHWHGCDIGEVVELVDTTDLKSVGN